MAKSFKKIVSLMLIVVLAAACFTGCSGKKTKKIEIRPFNNDDAITLQYAFWEDNAIFSQIVNDWNKIHPNCTIEPVPFPTGTFTESLKALFAAEEGPDIFGIIGSCDFAIENGMLLDMTTLWDYDNQEGTNDIIRGIKDFRIGNFSTERKWCTPIKFYPAAAFINKEMVKDANVEMPSMEWTWEEYQAFIEGFKGKTNATTGTPLCGMTCAGGCWTVTWYPIMSDGECIGEFGWTEGDEPGTGSYNMLNWATGLNLQRDWLKDRVIPPDTAEYRTETYGNADAYPQDKGDVAVRTDWWYSYTRYFDNESQPMLQNRVVFVPYMQPHLSTVDKEDYTYIATFDIGGISSQSGEYAVEAYEALKYFTWGAEGWRAKLKYYEGMVEDGVDYGVAGAKYYSNFPICSDDDIWESYRALWAGDDDSYGRGEYFDFFFDAAHNARWTCLGAPQIPGFGTWLDDYYFNNDFEGSGTYTGVEDAVLNGEKDALSYYEDLQEKGNEYYKERLLMIEAAIV